MNDHRHLTIEKFKEALEGINQLKIEPYKCLYCNVETHALIIELTLKIQYREFNLVGEIDLIVDKDIEPRHIIHCEPGVYEYWKKLKASSWIDHNDKTIDLWKVADALFQYENELKNNPVKIDFTFTPGEKFPTGATIRGLKISVADIPPTKF